MISSVRWPSEMALWTMHKSARLRSPDFDHNFIDNKIESKQKDYVRSACSGTPINIGLNSKAIDFLVLVGRGIHAYIDTLKRCNTETDAISNLQETVQSLLMEKRAVEQQASSFSSEYEFPSQIETADKVISLFQKTMEETLPQFFRQKNRLLSKIKDYKSKIQPLSAEYSERVKSICEELKNQIVYANECLVGNGRMEIALAELTSDAQSFLNFFSSSSSLSYIFDISVFSKKIQDNIFFIEKIKNDSADFFLSLQLGQVEKILEKLKEIADIRNAYQLDIDKIESEIKKIETHLQSQSYKNLEEEFFQKTLDIHVEAPSQDDDLFFGEMDPVNPAQFDRSFRDLSLIPPQASAI